MLVKTGTPLGINMSEELKTAIEAAKTGAKIALKYFNTDYKVDVKADKSPVTIADKEAEAAIKQEILRRFPGSTFLGEESSSDSHGDNFWIIDPIDGTRNFIRGFPFWGVEIAYIENGKILIGVSYSPLLNELLYAERGKGAFKNGEKINVSKVKHVKDAFFVHGTISYFKNIEGFLRICNTVERERGYGDFFGYHQIACGKSDIMMDAKNGPWDIAAVKVIIEEAGGKVTNHQGVEWSLSDSNCLATNGLLHDEVLKIYNGK